MLLSRPTLVLAILPISVMMTAPGHLTSTDSSPWRTVTFAGVSLRTPASWPVINLASNPSACPRLDVHAVYLGTPGPDPQCPAGLVGKTAAVMIQLASPRSPDVMEARTPVTIDHRPAWTTGDSAVSHSIVDVLPEAGADVSLSYGSDRALALRLQATIKISPDARAATIRRSAAVPVTAPQGVFQGSGFDSCTAPAAAAMKHWLASPYRAIGIYIGGANRACAQPNLTAAWIATIRAEGWHYFPIYPGLQASCAGRRAGTPIDPSKAAAEGAAAAQDAAKQAASLGIPHGTPITYDIEYYKGCRQEVVTFLSSWDATLHVLGFRAAVYESFDDVGGLIDAPSGMTEPDAIAYADWDNDPTTDSTYMARGLWADHQRIHQYRGGHKEKWGHVAMDIDRDQLDITLGGSVPLGRPPGGYRSFRISPAGSRSDEWFARSVKETLVHDYLRKSGRGRWTGVAPVGQSPSDIASNASVAAGPRGPLEVVARDTAGRVIQAWPKPGQPGGWEWGPPLGSPGDIIGGPAAIRRPGGAVTVFVTVLRGSVATLSQTEAGDTASRTAWSDLAGSCGSSPVPFLNSGGGLQAFCTTKAGSLAVDTLSGMSWSGWSAVGVSPGHLTATPTVAADARGQTEVFVATTSGRLDYAWQDPGTGRWTWGSAPAGGMARSKIKDSPVARLLPSGRVKVVAEQVGGQLGQATQRGWPGARHWSRRTSLGGDGLGSPAVWITSAGKLCVAMLDLNRQIEATCQKDRGWTRWTQLGGGF